MLRLCYSKTMQVESKLSANGDRVVELGARVEEWERQVKKNEEVLVKLTVRNGL